MINKYIHNFGISLTAIALLVMNAGLPGIVQASSFNENVEDYTEQAIVDLVSTSIGTNTQTIESSFTFDSRRGIITHYDRVAGGSDVVIPKVIGGVEVKSIDNHAFYRRGVSSVVIPEGVKKIGRGAFALNSLTEVIIPDSVTSIGDKAFFANYKLEKIIIPSSTVSMGVDIFDETSSNFIIYGERDSIAEEYANAYYHTFIEIIIKNETRIEEVDFEIEYIKNPELIAGNEEVFQEGTNGVRTIIEKVTTAGGEELKRKVISDDITTFPVNKVVQVGTKAHKIEDNATVFTEETREEEVAFKIEYVKNPDLLAGKQEVSQEGVGGIRTIITKVTTAGGEELKRKVISDDITTVPVNKVVQIGTKAHKIEDNVTVFTEETREEVAFEIEYVKNQELPEEIKTLEETKALENIDESEEVLPKTGVVSTTITSLLGALAIGLGSTIGFKTRKKLNKL